VLVQEVASDLVLMVLVLYRLYLRDGRVVQVLGDGAWFGAVEVAPLEECVHSVLETGLKDGPVRALSIKGQDVSGQLLNVRSRIYKWRWG